MEENNVEIKTEGKPGQESLNGAGEKPEQKTKKNVAKAPAKAAKPAARAPKPKQAPVKAVLMPEVKIFNKWSTKGIEVKDLGLQRYISLKPVIVPKSRGRMRSQFHKSEMNIVERLINHLLVPGHRGKKHLLSSGNSGGKTATAFIVVKKVLQTIEDKTKKNPIEVLVRAVENSALREEITSYQVGGIMVRKAVVAAPQRRVDLALRTMVQGAYQKAHSNPKGFAAVLADELIAAGNADSQNSYGVREKERVEREAGGAR